MIEQYKNGLVALVRDCARCGETHDVTVKPFQRQPHPDVRVDCFGFCENTGEPILMIIEEVNEVDEPD